MNERAQELSFLCPKPESTFRKFKIFLKVKSILQEHRYKYKTLLYNKGKVTCERRKLSAVWSESKSSGRLKNGRSHSVGYFLFTCLVGGTKNFKKKRKRFIHREYER